jgi:cellulose synthase/poly-beta-1,6-N-acetylglucosamine synthase-like glycosyltransferase
MEISTVLGMLLPLASFYYLLVHSGLVMGRKRAPSAPNPEQPFVSVIVAARNEQATIGKVLQCLSYQTYPNFEVIIINDRSSDRTGHIIAELCLHNPAFHLVDLTKNAGDMPAKKNALRSGIQVSKGEILCFTDADCFPPPAWIEELVKQFQPDVGLAAGYSPYRMPSGELLKRNFFTNSLFTFIAYEEFRAALWSAGAIGWSLGWLCTGRNLAYRRTVYDEVGGFEQIKHSISGDDDLFLQLVRRETQWKIRYLQTTLSFVPTLPPSDFSAFIEQRKRHFSASKYFTLPMKLFFFFYHSANLILFLSPFLFFLGWISVQSVLASVFLKLAADTILILPSTRAFQAEEFRSTYLFMEVLYILYNSFIGPLGLLQKFTWKQK